MAKEKKEKKVKTEKKSFMKDFKAELKKVVWPTSKQMVNNVTAVITIVLITAAIVFVLDFVYGLMNEYGINKLKAKVQSNNQEQTQIVNQINTIEQKVENNEAGSNNNTTENSVENKAE